MTREQCVEMNDAAHKFDVQGNDYVSFLYEDHNEQEELRRARREEEEKQAISGKKGRRERRQFRERKLVNLQRRLSPPRCASNRVLPFFLEVWSFIHVCGQLRRKEQSESRRGRGRGRGGVEAGQTIAVSLSVAEDDQSHVHHEFRRRVRVGQRRLVCQESRAQGNIHPHHGEAT